MLKRNAALALLATVLFAACGHTAASYFSFAESLHQGGVVNVGDRVLIGVQYLTVSSADTVTLLSATPENVKGTSDAFSAYVLPRNASKGRGIGFTAERSLPTDFLFNDWSKPLAGYAITKATGTVQVDLAITPSSSATITYDDVLLRFKVNGGSEQSQSLTSSSTICVRPSDPTPCR